MSIADEARQIRSARNQSLFRDVNERIESLNEGFGMILPLGEWVCECADDACIEPIQLTVPEYEDVREHADRFIVLSGHEQLDVERVVERHERYVVVEMIGKAAAIACEHDHRSQS